MQVWYVCKEDVFTYFDGTGSERMFMTDALRWGVGPAGKSVIRLGTSDGTWWRTISIDGRIYVPSLLQMYFQKTQTTLEASGLFYVLHIKILHVKHDEGKRMITTRLTPLAYLPKEVYIGPKSGLICFHL